MFLCSQLIERWLLQELHCEHIEQQKLAAVALFLVVLVVRDEARVLVRGLLHGEVEPVEMALDRA